MIRLDIGDSPTDLQILEILCGDTKPCRRDVAALSLARSSLEALEHGAGVALELHRLMDWLEESIWERFDADETGSAEVAERCQRERDLLRTRVCLFIRLANRMIKWRKTQQSLMPLPPTPTEQYGFRELWERAPLTGQGKRPEGLKHRYGPDADGAYDHRYKPFATTDEAAMELYATLVGTCSDTEEYDDLTSQFELLPKEQRDRVVESYQAEKKAFQETALARWKARQ